MRALVRLLPLIYFLVCASPISPAAEPEDSREYGPVAAGEGMWTIAGKTRPDKSVSHHQMMLALLRANPEAFQYSCNLLSLRRGAMLKIPDLETIQSLSRAEALAEFKRQQDAWAAHRKGRTLVCPEIEEPPPPAEETDPAVENPAIPLAADASPALPRTPPPSPPGEPASPDASAEKPAAPLAAETSPALPLISPPEPPPEPEPATGQGGQVSVGEPLRPPGEPESPPGRISKPHPVGTESPAPVAPASAEPTPWQNLLRNPDTLWALLLIGLLLLWLGLRLEQGPGRHRAEPVLRETRREMPPAWLGEQVRTTETVPPSPQVRPPPAFSSPAAPETSLPPDSEAAALGAELDRLFAGQVFSPRKGEQAEHFFDEADFEALPGDTAPPTERDLDDIPLAAPPRHSSLS